MMSGLFYSSPPVSTQPFPPSTATLGLAIYIGIPAIEFNHQYCDDLAGYKSRGDWQTTL
jgi:hypothetical protein